MLDAALRTEADAALLVLDYPAELTEELDCPLVVLPCNPDFAPFARAFGCTVNQLRNLD